MGNVKIGNVSAGFKSIVVDQNMGDLTIGIDPKAGYKLTAEVNMGSIKVPEGLKLTKEKESDLPGITLRKYPELLEMVILPLRSILIWYPSESGSQLQTNISPI
ncbi:MAG: hypothetical protein WC865_00120 [Bacteroidales bacterium]